MKKMSIHVIKPGTIKIKSVAFSLNNNGVCKILFCLPVHGEENPFPSINRAQKINQSYIAFLYKKRIQLRRLTLVFYGIFCKIVGQNLIFPLATFSSGARKSLLLMQEALALVHDSWLQRKMGRSFLQDPSNSVLMILRDTERQNRRHDMGSESFYIIIV